MSGADKVWTVLDVMVEDVVTVTPETPYRQLVELLWTYGISGLPVVKNGGLVGIVSESDLLARQESGVPVATTSGSGREFAADVMTAPVVTVAPEASLTERLMRQRGLKRLPVVDADSKLVGIVSRADLLKVFLRSEDTLLWDAEDVLRRCLVQPGTVTISTRDGVVRLTGAVDSSKAAEKIQAAVQKLAGVVSVESELTWPAAVG
jgi:CBS-domain-containing membrane protein